MVKIYYNGKQLGFMDKWDSRSYIQYINSKYSSTIQDEWFDLQDKYQAKFGISDMLDFVVDK